MISRKRTALAAATLVLGGGLALLPAAGASAAPASATAYSCNYYKGSDGNEYAGHYSGRTVVPSSTTVTSAGIEAQCLLKRMHAILPDRVSSPGTVDGIFGTNSKASMRSFQRFANRDWGAGLGVDGLPGPQSWPWLRGLTV
jgi:peptidoglycan hydrolase-like protein with peptidoglycan-binding domain